MFDTMPDDGEDCWFRRIGDPEKPIRGTWREASLDFLATASGDNATVPVAIVAKWRPVTP